MTEADDVINSLIRHLNNLNDKDRIVFLNGIVWMLVDKADMTKHDKIGILETTKFKIMGDVYGRCDAKFKG